MENSKFHYWGNITPWDNYAGKVTLAGDAAHPMVPCKYFGHCETTTDLGSLTYRIYSPCCRIEQRHGGRKALRRRHQSRGTQE